MAEGGQHRILVIDDDTLFPEIARVNLERRGFSVETADDPRQGVNLAIDSQFDLILLDLMMPGLHGEEVLSWPKPLGTRQRILVVSGHKSETYRSRARDLGVVGYLEKPVTEESLFGAVQEVLEGSTSDDDNDGLSGGNALDGLVLWVFGVGTVTPVKRVASIGVVLILVCVLCWLIWG